MSIVRAALEAFANFEGAPFGIQEEIERWESVFEGREDAVRAWLRPRFKHKKWVSLEEVATALGVDVATESQGVGPIGPISRQWSEASVRWPCGPQEARVRASQAQRVASRRAGPTEDEAREWTRALTAARVADGHPPHRLVGPARFEAEAARNEAYRIARSQGRHCLSDEQDRAFAAYLRAADLQDAAAGWEVPPSPTAQAQAEEADAGLPPAARRFVGR